MTHDEILSLLYEETLVGNAPAVSDGVNQGLESGLAPEKMLFDALIPSLEEVGARFERGDYFVPEMLIAARAMQGALDILRPLLAETGTKPVGTFLMGTVKGDVHDIGKNLCNIMLEGAGFEVIDLGVNVAPEKFVEAVQTHQPDLLGMSAFLTTTMPMFKVNVEALKKAGLRDSVKIMCGGAPVTAQFAEMSGADAFCPDASATARRAKELIGLAGEAPSGALAEAVKAVEKMMGGVEE
jgi:methylmalonyl-CoA mutase cobalamin-binding domain/chain